MKRLAYFCLDPGIGVFGTKGASVHVQEVVRSFRSIGWDVTVYCTRRGDLVPSDLADLRVIELRVGKGPVAERERSVTSASHALAAEAVADRFDLALERYSLFSTAGARATRELGRPFVVEVNAPLVDEQGQHRQLLDAQGAWSSTRRTFAAADQLICVSEPVASWVRALVDDDRTVRVVPNGVNTRRIRPSTAPASSTFTVGFVGTLKPWHGVDVLLDAFARAAPAGVPGRGRQRTQSDWRLLLCGDGPERPAVEQLAHRLGVRIELTGSVPPEEIPAQLARMDVAVAPYPAADERDHYFSPLKLYEYFAAGLPVIASQIGQSATTVEHGHTGLLVPPGDVDALATSLTALHLDPALRARLGAAAREVAVRQHDWDSVVHDILDHMGVAAT